MNKQVAREDKMARKTPGGAWVGVVEGRKSGHQYTVRVTPLQKIVVVNGGERGEWRWPLADYQHLNPAHAILFRDVAALLRDKGFIS